MITDELDYVHLSPEEVEFYHLPAAFHRSAAPLHLSSIHARIDTEFARGATVEHPDVERLQDAARYLHQLVVEDGVYAGLD